MALAKKGGGDPFRIVVEQLTQQFTLLYPPLGGRTLRAKPFQERSKFPLVKPIDSAPTQKAE